MPYNYISKSYPLEILKSLKKKGGAASHTLKKNQQILTNIRYEGNAIRGFLQFFTIFLLIVIPIFIKQKNPWSISIFQDAPLCIYSFARKKSFKKIKKSVDFYTMCNTLSHEHYWNWTQLGSALHGPFILVMFRAEGITLTLNRK
jgi:hypothetical protein